jgi:hypothetical protein
VPRHDGGASRAPSFLAKRSPLFVPRPELSPAVVAAILLVSAVAWCVTPPTTILWWTAESGPIEALTAVLYWMAAGLVLLGFADESRTRGSAVAMALLLAGFAARELDWHVEFTGSSLLRVSYYLGDAPIRHKLGALLAVLVLAWAAVFLLRRHGRQLLHDFRGARPVAITCATVLVTMAATKIVDRSLGVLRESFDVVSSTAVQALQAAVEEPLELGLPVLVIVGLVQVRSSLRHPLAAAA